MIVACISLTVALGGTSYAAIKLPKNSIGAKQLKKNAVTSLKIKANAVTSPKVKNNSLTGADVNEASLGTVPAATNATSATNATNAASAANASTLNGFAARDLSRLGMASNTSDTGFAPPYAALGDLLSVTLTVPGSSNQYVRVSGHFSWVGSSGSCPCYVNSRVVQDTTEGPTDYYRDTLTSLNQDVAGSDWVFLAAPGTHTYKLQGAVFQASSGFLFFNANLIAQTVPFGSGGGAPAVIGAGPHGSGGSDGAP
jgi:hypothetical protein